MKAPASFLMQEAALLHQRGELAQAAARYGQVLALEKVRDVGELMKLTAVKG